VDGHVFLLQLGDGAVGRTRGAGDDRWPLGLRRARPERPAADALRRDRRRSDDRGVRDRHGPDRRGHRRRKGRAGPGPDDRRRHGGQKLFHDTEIKDSSPPRDPSGMGRQDHRPGRGDARRDGKGAVRGRNCAAARSRPAIPSRSWSRSSRRWPRTARKRWPRWATTPRRRCCRASIARSATISGRTSARSRTRPSTRLREYRVMSLKTRFGNLKNVLDEDSSQTEILVLDSPFVANAQFDEMVSHFGDSVVGTSTAPSPPTVRRRAAPGAGPDPAEAEDAVRSGAGHIILTDHAGRDRQCADADDPGHQRGAFLADAAGSAHLLLAQRAVGRMHRPALLRGADGLRRDHGERLSRAGFHRGPDRARPARRVADRGDGTLPQRHRPGSA
jgi:hypothetical protein